MPEGPEVESVRRSLLPLLGARVVAATLRRRDIVTQPGTAATRGVPRADLLLNQSIVALERHGKQLALIADSGRVLLVHLGMTGKLILDQRDRSPSLPHTHAQWTLQRDRRTPDIRLRFVDPRRFGGLWTIPSRDALAARWADLGPDATAVESRHLAPALARRSAPIKAVLLDQAVVAGVGNIYADESLFAAGIHPRLPANSLNQRQIERLTASIQSIILAAIDAGGSTIRDYTDSLGNTGAAQADHMVYARAGLPCLRCSTPLADAVIAQRTTVWCPACQPPTPGETAASSAGTTRVRPMFNA